MSTDNHQAYVAIPMNLFSSTDDALEAPLSSRRERCRQACSRDSYRLPRLVTAVVVIVGVVFIPMWVYFSHHHHKMWLGLEARGGKKDNRYRHHHRNKRDSLYTYYSQDVVVMDVIEDDVMFEEEQQQNGSLVKDNLQEIEDETVDELVADELGDEEAFMAVEQEAVDEPMQFYAAPESSGSEEEKSREEDGK